MNYPIYEFHYPDKNITQRKVLIPKEVYETYKAIQDYDEAKKFLKSHTKGMEWFIPSSPYYDAIESGFVDANGRHRAEVIRISKQS
jgi:hypothetical protein